MRSCDFCKTRVAAETKLPDGFRMIDHQGKKVLMYDSDLIMFLVPCEDCCPACAPKEIAKAMYAKCKALHPAKFGGGKAKADPPPAGKKWYCIHTASKPGERLCRMCQDLDVCKKGAGKKARKGKAAPVTNPGATGEVPPKDGINLDAANGARALGKEG